MQNHTNIQYMFLSELPTFPNFLPLGSHHKEEIEIYSKQFLPYSDYNFTSMWCYNTDDDFKVSKLNHNLILLFRDYITNQPFYTFLGHNKVKDTVDTLLNHAVENNLLPELKLIPEFIISQNPTLINHFIVNEDPDNFDYIFSTHELSELQGRKYYDKRNLLKRFQKDNPDAKIGLIDIKDPNIQKQIIDLFHTWAEKKNLNIQDFGHELKATKRLFSHALHSPLTTIGIYINNALIGFLVVEEVHHKYSVFQFMKAHPAYKGTTEALNHHAAQYLKDKNIDYINYEQDLGIPGLRSAKTFWNPTHYLKKYKILPRK